MYAIMGQLLLATVIGQQPTQCFDQFGRQVSCYPGNGAPSLSSASWQFNNRLRGGAAIAESFRDGQPSQQQPVIRVEFFGAEPPEEIVIRGVVWRRIR